MSFPVGGGEVCAGLPALIAGLLLAWYCRMLLCRMGGETSGEESACLGLLRGMAAAVAHDFNNVLGSMTLFAQLLKGVRLDGEGACYLDNLLVSCRLGQNYTSNLQVFAGVRPYQPQKFPVGRLLDTVTPVLRLIMPDVVAVSFPEIDRELVIRGEQFLVEQAVINLALNSRDAMADGGSLEISCKRVARLPESPDAEEEGARPAASAVLSVRDTGKGIDPGALERITDPFYTTKDSKGRIGLGLPVVRRIMEMHGGRLVVRSVPGRGTTVELHFPLA
ncbi:MAG: ATP-binding protein [Thermodesulfobacteriota bacterium]